MTQPLTPTSPLLAHVLTCEYGQNPLGLDQRQPRLGWQLQTDRRSALQTAYQVQVVRAEHAPHSWTNPLWDTGKVVSDQSAHVPYTGPALESRARYYWRVRVWDESAGGEPGAAPAWSELAFWEVGLLRASDWLARWIEPVQEPAEREPELIFFQKLAPQPPGTPSGSTRLKPCQYLRRAFAVSGPVRRARVYATAHGVYRLSINGTRCGSQELAPETSPYPQLLQYQVYDVTTLLPPGQNTIGAVLGDGWWIGRLGLPGDSCNYGNRLITWVSAPLFTPDCIDHNGRYYLFFCTAREMTTQGVGGPIPPRARA